MSQGLLPEISKLLTETGSQIDFRNIIGTVLVGQQLIKAYTNGLCQRNVISNGQNLCHLQNQKLRLKLIKQLVVLEM